MAEMCTEDSKVSLTFFQRFEKNKTVQKLKLSIAPQVKNKMCSAFGEFLLQNGVK